MTESLRIDPREALPASDVRFNSDGEPVFALMVTGKDRFHAWLARNAIVSFLAQTYGNRFLVIVNDGDFTFECVDVPRDRITQVQLAERQVLGALRNRSLDCVPAGALWVQWDDDDWHHPELIAKQYEVLAAHQAEACLLRHQVKYAFSAHAGWSDFFPGGFAGTLMARNRPDLRYPNVPRSEDSAFCHALKQTCHWIAWDNPAHYYLRFIHGHNTWPDSHFQLSARSPGQWTMSAESAAYLRAVLPWYEPLFSGDSNRIFRKQS
jgi:hypothetical protein